MKNTVDYQIENSIFERISLITNVVAFLTSFCADDDDDDEDGNSVNVITKRWHNYVDLTYLTRQGTSIYFRFINFYTFRIVCTVIYVIEEGFSGVIFPHITCEIEMLFLSYLTSMVVPFVDYHHHNFPLLPLFSFCFIIIFLSSFFLSQFLRLFNFVCQKLFLMKFYIFFLLFLIEWMDEFCFHKK